MRRKTIANVRGFRGDDVGTESATEGITCSSVTGKRDDATEGKIDASVTGKANIVSEDNT